MSEKEASKPTFSAAMDKIENFFLSCYKEEFRNFEEFKKSLDSILLACYKSKLKSAQESCFRAVEASKSSYEIAVQMLEQEKKPSEIDSTNIMKCAQINLKVPSEQANTFINNGNREPRPTQGSLMSTPPSIDGQSK